LREITNAQLRKIIDRIEVDHEGNVEIYLKLFKELGIEQTVPIYSDCTYSSNTIERFVWMVA
ncbi:MAG: hypothetical protein IIW79_04320, partial [Clostridia bacterium]|nr:hypothetical protein [Clostridia bacterium]